MGIVEEALRATGLEVSAAQVQCLDGLASLLGGEAMARGLSAISGDREIAAKHLADSAYAAKWLLEHDSDSKRLVDVGTGAGVPGLVLGSLVPGLSIHLLDSKRRALDWVREASGRLGLPGIEFKWTRAEDFGRGEGREAYEFAVTRAVGSMSVSLELCLPLVKVDGYFLAMRGVDFETQDAVEASGLLGAKLDAVVPYCLPWDMGQRHLVVFRKIQGCPGRYPRPCGKIRKRPIVFHVKHSHHT